LRQVEELEGEKQELEEQKEELEGKLEKLEPFEALEGRDCYTDWSRQLVEEVNGAWDDRLKSRYRRVKVLMVQWASDDLGVSSEIDQLGQVFTYVYKCEVSNFPIPDYQPSTALSTKVIEFMDAHAPDTLLIFYYSGHGCIDESRNESYWAA
jgi:hypothetical protein